MQSTAKAKRKDWLLCWAREAPSRPQDALAIRRGIGASRLESWQGASGANTGKGVWRSGDMWTWGKTAWAFTVDLSNSAR